MMILIKNVDLYAPASKGIKDILIGGGVILEIADSIHLSIENVVTIDAEGMVAVPGYMDQHVHITGGGGEGGMHTRVPEIMLSELVRNGITSVVGLLGTDSVTRNVEGLLAKAKALNEEGITAWILTGAYEFPSPTLTGSVKKDIVLIEEVIGAKIAISDHRDSRITWQELARLATEARVGGMIGGKPGIVTVHLGNGEEGLQPIKTILNETNIPMKHFIPTHINRNPQLLAEGLDYARIGGTIDLSATKNPNSSPAAIVSGLEADFPLERITFSSDGNGSTSSYDDQGNLIRISSMSVDTMPYQVKTLICEYGFSVDNAIQFITSNVAKVLGVYPRKGALQVGSDADILLLNAAQDIDTVFARGKMMMRNGEMIEAGTFEI
jgi:beta-aspartyl-dipeptidase (metallo-type)